jgi:hypothetical protein
MPSRTAQSHCRLIISLPVMLSDLALESWRLETHVTAWPQCSLSGETTLFNGGVSRACCLLGLELLGASTGLRAHRTVQDNEQPRTKKISNHLGRRPPSMCWLDCQTPSYLAALSYFKPLPTSLRCRYTQIRRRGPSAHHGSRLNEHERRTRRLQDRTIPLSYQVSTTASPLPVPTMSTRRLQVRATTIPRP